MGEPVRIEETIVGYEVVEPEPPKESLEKEKAPATQAGHEEGSNVVQMQPLLKRPEVLRGATYKITTPLSEHALYVTINDIEVNGKRRPFEVFINSKNMENFSWIVALTLVISAVFRQASDPSFLVEELRSVFDPRGGYFKPGGRYMPSLVAEIGACIERHMIGMGVIQVEEVSEELAVKRQLAEAKGIKGSLCQKCNQMSMVRLDGCDTCLECGYSKCG